MSPENFVYWLRGFFEITRAGKEPGEIALDATQVEMIERHLDLVLTAVASEAPASVPADMPVEDVKKLIEQMFSKSQMETGVVAPARCSGGGPRRYC